MEDKDRDRKQEQPTTMKVEELERRVAPSVANKKAPVPPPYAPGTDYGLVRRANLEW